jgi:hypothetical protein
LSTKEVSVVIDFEYEWDPTEKEYAG